MAGKDEELVQVYGRSPVNMLLLMDRICSFGKEPVWPHAAGRAPSNRLCVIDSKLCTDTPGFSSRISEKVVIVL